jgi:hypothetical protein
MYIIKRQGNKEKEKAKGTQFETAAHWQGVNTAPRSASVFYAPVSDLTLFLHLMAGGSRVSGGSASVVIVRRAVGVAVVITPVAEELRQQQDQLSMGIAHLLE